MASQFSDLERKSIKPIARAVEQLNVRAMQRFVREIPWDAIQALNIVVC